MTWGKAPQAGGNVVGILPFGKEAGHAGDGCRRFGSGIAGADRKQKKGAGGHRAFLWGGDLGEVPGGTG